MSLLDEAKMPSLKDKIREQAIEQTKEEAKRDESEAVKKVEVKVKKGRKLNK